MRVLKLLHVDPYKVRLLLLCLQKLILVMRQSIVVTANNGYYLLAYYLYIVLYLHENTTRQNFDNSMFRYDAILELSSKVNEAVFSCSSKYIRLFYLRVPVTVWNQMKHKYTFINTIYNEEKQNTLTLGCLRLIPICIKLIHKFIN